MPRFSSERPALLRRRATFLEEQAGRASDPDAARALARKMRERATELEAGPEPTEEEETRRLLAIMAGEQID